MYGRAACGGLLRDHDAHFVVGFATNIRLCSVLAVESWANYYKGLQLAL